MSKKVSNFTPMPSFKDAMIIGVLDLTLGVGLKEQKFTVAQLKVLIAANLPSLGAQDQVPFMNDAETDFDYSPNLTFGANILRLGPTGTPGVLIALGTIQLNSRGGEGVESIFSLTGSDANVDGYNSLDIINPDNDADLNGLRVSIEVNNTTKSETVVLFDIKNTAGGSLTNRDLLSITNDDVEVLRVEDNGVIQTPGLKLSGGSDSLKNYEESTATITIADAETGGNEGSTGLMTYTRIGNRCFYELTFTNIDTTGLTGGNSAYFTGLPFTSLNDTAAAIFYDTMNFAAGKTQLVGRIGDADDFIRIKVCGDNVVDSFVLVSDITDDLSDFTMSGHFAIAS